MTARPRTSISCPEKGALQRRRQRSESGYAYLMALFLVLVMVAASQAALQNLYTQGRRQREDDMIWRGNQYARAIRLYYRKTGHYPQSLDDLQTGLPDLHFLRYSAYKDPMNKTEDGAWRLIYVNATGQIIGSVRYATLQQMAIMDLNGGVIPPLDQMGALPGQMGSLVGTPASSLGLGSSGANSPSNSTSSGNANSANPQNPSPGDNSSVQSSSGSSTGNSAPGGAPSPAAGQSTSSDDQLVNPLALLKPTGPVDGPVLGAFLTGVGGGTKSDTPSIKVLNGGKKYKDWEFIWNPLEDQARAVQQGLSSPGQPIGQPVGAGGIGTANPGGNSPGFGGAVVPPSTQPQPQNQ